jgi:succinate dehydrogenase/fumarate reductase flavoprotein subunit
LEFDVVGVGGGNAAQCAAVFARNQGASTLLLEAGGEDEAGGNRSAGVLSTDGDRIPGRYAVREMVGGISCFNCPGGTGLSCGSVFGKIAGASARLHAKSNQDASRVASLLEGA